MFNKDFTHLHLHSQYSLLDGAIKFDKLLGRCKQYGMESVAVRDCIHLGSLHPGESKKQREVKESRESR